VPDQLAAENRGKLARGVAAQELHLPQAVLRRHIPLRKHQVLDRAGVDVRDAARVALHRHRRTKAIDRQRAVELWQRLAHGLLGIVASANQSSRCQYDQHHADHAEHAQSPVPGAPRRRFESSVSRPCRPIGNRPGVAGVEIVRAHRLGQV